MIKIIKEGKKEFIAKCPTCGCEFSYETFDIRAGLVVCPTCACCVEHKIEKFETPTFTTRPGAIPGRFAQQPSTEEWHPSNVVITASDFEAIQTIYDLCIDYDDFNTVESFKSLLDDIRKLTEEIVCKRKSVC